MGNVLVEGSCAVPGSLVSQQHHHSQRGWTSALEVLVGQLWLQVLFLSAEGWAEHNGLSCGARTENSVSSLLTFSFS